MRAIWRYIMIGLAGYLVILALAIAILARQG